jgi:hypothetical protein
MGERFLDGCEFGPVQYCPLFFFRDPAVYLSIYRSIYLSIYLACTAFAQ